MVNEQDNIINEYHLNKHQPGKPQFAVFDLSRHLKINKSQVTKPHIHSFYQIIWFKRGKGKHFVDFKTYDVFDNAIFLVAPNQVHYFDRHTGYEGVLIHFNEAFLIKNENEMEFFLKCNLFNNPYQQPSCRIGGEIENTLNEYISQIEREFKRQEVFGKELLLRNYLKSFLIQVQRGKHDAGKSSGQLKELADVKRLQLVRFINLINENYTKGYTIRDYARLLHISSRGLSELTHQRLNKTPSQMIQERIILEAQRMLLYSNLNISQIGYRLGFDDPSYFVKYFKKQTHISPLEFRKSVS